jgi:Do/DeqQ family serine protease
LSGGNPLGRPRAAWAWALAAALLLGGIAHFQSKARRSRAPEDGGRGAGAPRVSADLPARDLQDSFARVAAAVRPTVVSITTVHVETARDDGGYEFFFGDPQDDDYAPDEPGSPHRGRRRPSRRRYEGMGSGVVVDPDGYILTNEHVIRGAKELRVTLLEPDERQYTGKVVGQDPRTDLAVVKINAKERLPSARLGDSGAVRVGDWVIAVGSPFGLEQTVTAGIVSAVRQSLNIEGRTYSDLLQTDAAINQGNSGGPLIDLRGDVVGINTAIYGPTGVFSGVGFAIPANRAREIMQQLIERGRVVRGWMGVEIVGMDDVLAREFRAPDRGGVLVNGVLPGSPAEKAGLRRGDVIREFGGRKVEGQESLIETVSHTPPRTRVKLVIFRDGRPMELFLVTGEMPAETEEGEAVEGDSPEPAESSTWRWEGAVWTTASGPSLRRYGLPADLRGVLVLDVVGDGLADRLALEEGDLVVSVNRTPTHDLDALRRASRGLDPAAGVLFDVNRAGRWMYLSYKAAE